MTYLLTEGIVKVHTKPEPKLSLSKDHYKRWHYKHLDDNWQTVHIASYLLELYRRKHMLEDYEIMAEVWYVGCRLDLALTRGNYEERIVNVEIGVEIGDTRIEKIIEYMTLEGNLKELWHFPYGHKEYFIWRKGDLSKPTKSRINWYQLNREALSANPLVKPEIIGGLNE